MGAAHEARATGHSSGVTVPPSTHSPAVPQPPVGTPAQRPAGPGESAAANRLWWDAAAPSYYAEHGAYLGDTDLLWCPEGWREAEVELLGPAAALAGAAVLEIGCGAAQGARWLRAQGARVLALDVSLGQLRTAMALDRQHARESGARYVQADAQHLPVRTASCDLVVSAFGALPFVADAPGTWAEVARVLRPGGRVVASVAHPVRWAFPDDPGEGGLTVRQSYFDRTPYVEEDERGRAVYVEHHRTVGDWVRAVVGAGLVLDDLLEPEWPPDLTHTWGQWSPLRGALLPGTLVICASKP